MEIISVDSTIKIKDRAEDLTGRSRLLSNVFFSWLGYIVVIVSGFIMPRLIDYHMGQTLLGIWDFAWSITHYIEMQSFGIGSSINRYVAKYRAANDINSLNTTISSVMFLQFFIAIYCALLTCIIVAVMPLIFSEKLDESLPIARWVVAFLGASVAVQMAFDASRGIISGCHRWDLYNIISSLSRGAIIVGLIISVFCGGGLISLSVIYFVITVCTEVWRMVLAFRICPEISLERKYISLSQTKKMIGFGIKTAVASLAPFLLFQTINLLIVGFLNVAMLAIFSRCTALIRHLETIVNKFAYILTPTAGSLHSTGQVDSIKRFLIETSKYGAAIALPLVILFAVDGNLILKAWMGPAYEKGFVLMILAIGSFLPIAQSSVMRILMGMNMHGKIGLISLSVILSVFGVGIILLNYVGWTLERSAVLLILPLAIGNGIIVPIYACKKLSIPLFHYLAKSFTKPLLCNIIFIGVLFSSRLIFPQYALIMLFVSLTLGGVILLLLYYLFILEDDLRRKVSRKLFKKNE